MKHGRSGRLIFSDMLLFGGTRVALGMGAGFLLSRRLNQDQRKAAGIALAAVGGLTTIPLAIRFSAYREWKKARLGTEHGSGCQCGCPHCCPPKSAESPYEGKRQEAPSA